MLSRKTLAIVLGMSIIGNSAQMMSVPVYAEDTVIDSNDEINKDESREPQKADDNTNEDISDDKEDVKTEDNVQEKDDNDITESSSINQESGQPVSSEGESDSNDSADTSENTTEDDDTAEITDTDKNAGQEDVSVDSSESTADTIEDDSKNNDAVEQSQTDDLFENELQKASDDDEMPQAEAVDTEEGITEISENSMSYDDYLIYKGSHAKKSLLRRRTISLFKVNNHDEEIKQKIIDAINNHEEEADITEYVTYDEAVNGDFGNKVCSLYYDVLHEHPELFWSSPTTVSRGGSTIPSQNKVQKYNLKISYIYDADVLETMKNDLDNKIASIYNNCLKKCSTDIEKEFAIHDYLILNSTYDRENFNAHTVPDNEHTAYSALVKGITVCDGYSKAAKMLFDKCGIESGIITNDDHAWNYVNINGEYYQTDITWDDPDSGNDILYKHFNCSSDAMKAIHPWTSELPGSSDDFKDDTYDKIFRDSNNSDIVRNGHKIYYGYTNGSLKSLKCSDLSTDGKTETLVSSSSSLTTAGGNYYYIDGSNKLHEYKLDNNSDMIVEENANWNIILSNANCIYYEDNSSQIIYKFNVKTNKKNELVNINNIMNENGAGKYNTSYEYDTHNLNVSIKKEDSTEVFNNNFDMTNDDEDISVEVSKYNVTVQNTEGITISTDAAEGKSEAGKEVNVTVDNATGKNIKKVVIKKADGTAADAVKNEDGTYSFTMPEQNVDISVELESVSEPVEVSKYNVTVQNEEGITVSTDAAEGKSEAGKEVKITVNNATGKNIKKVVIKKADGTAIDAVKNEDGTYSFTMPEQNVDISVELESVSEPVEESKYNVTVQNEEGITISTDAAEGKSEAGKEVKITVNNATGKNIKKVVIKKADGTAADAVKNEDGTYSFTMPEQNVDISVELESVSEPVEVSKYNVIVQNEEGITVSTDAAEGKSEAGKEVKITVNNATGKNIKKVVIKKADGTAIDAVKNEDGTYSFTMPEQNIDISVELESVSEPVEESKYNVTVQNEEGITVSTDAAEGKSEAGKEVNVTVNNATGKNIKKVVIKKADGTAIDAVKNEDGTYSFTMPEQNIDISVELESVSEPVEESKYNVTVQNEEGITISTDAAEGKSEAGKEVKITVNNATGKNIKKVVIKKADGTAIDAVKNEDGTYSFTMPEQNIDISVELESVSEPVEESKYNVTVQNEEGITISTDAAEGKSEAGKEVKITVNNATGKNIKKVVIKKADGTAIDAVKNEDGTYSFTMPEQNIDISVELESVSEPVEESKYNVTVQNEDGITVSTDAAEGKSEAGKEVNVTVNNATGKNIKKVVIKKADGTAIDAVKNEDGTYSFTMPEQNVDISVELESVSEPVEVSKYNVTVQNEEGITVSTDAAEGKSEAGKEVKITVNNATGKNIKKVVIKKADGTAIDAVKNEDGTYSFTMPEQNVDISVELESVSEPVEESKYNVTVQNEEGITVSTDAAEGKSEAGKEVKITVNNATGKNIKKVVIKKADGTAIDTVKNEDGTYTFTMPEQNIDISVELESASKPVEVKKYSASSEYYPGINVWTTTGDHGLTEAGKEIKVTIDNTSGKTVKGIVVKGEDGTVIENKANSDGTYTFIMPEQNVMISVIAEQQVSSSHHHSSHHHSSSSNDSNSENITVQKSDTSDNSNSATVNTDVIGETAKSIGVQVKDRQTIKTESNNNAEKISADINGKPVDIITTHSEDTIKIEADENKKAYVFIQGLNVYMPAESSIEGNGLIIKTKPDKAYVISDTAVGQVVGTGWNKVNDSWYVINKDGDLLTGWYKDNNQTWYNLDKTGKMLTGWLKDNNQWYYLKDNGAMATGWIKDSSSNWYYLNENGSMKTGWLQSLDGNWYYLKSNGAMASNETIDGYYVGINGQWIK